MKAIILGAGEGVRLRPHTLDRPKCLVRLAGRSLLERGIDALRAAGVDDVVVVTGYRGDAIRALGLTTVENPEFARSNMVQSLICAADHLDGSDDVIVAYADIVYEPHVVRALIGSGGDVAIAVNTRWRELWSERMENPLADAETMKIDGAGNVVELGRKPSSYADVQGQYMGLIRFDAAAAAKIPAVHAALDPAGPYEGRDRANMFMTSFLQHWIDHVGPIRAALAPGGWIEVDTVTDLEVYEAMARDGRLAAHCRLADV